MYKLGVWWQRCDDHWHKGGGATAARLWWLAFVLTAVVIVAPVMPFANGYSYQHSAMSRSLSNVKQIGTGLMLYVQDYDERLPPMTSSVAAKEAVFPYVKNNVVFQTPRTHTLYAVNPSLSLHPLQTFPHPDKIVAVWDTKPYGVDKRRVAGFLDGHAKSVTAEEWRRLRAASGIRYEPPAPPPLPWWDMRSENFPNVVSLVLNTLFCAAGASAILAAWREAWAYADGRNRFLLHFTGWFFLRLFGWGFLVVMAALTSVMAVGMLFWLISFLFQA